MSFRMKKSLLIFVFSIEWKHSKKHIFRRNQQKKKKNLLVLQRWLASESFHASAPGSDSTLAQHLNSCTSSAGSRWKNPQLLLAYGCPNLIIFFWDNVKAPFYCCVVNCCLNDALVLKVAIIYVATDELWCSSLLINTALRLHSSLPAALIYLPVTNRPLGGNISPAAVVLTDWSYWLVQFTQGHWAPYRHSFFLMDVHVHLLRIQLRHRHSAGKQAEASMQMIRSQQYFFLFTAP